MRADVLAGLLYLTINKETNMLNLTPHAITVQLPNGSERTFQPSGTVARVVTFQTSAANLDGIPTSYRRTGNVEGLTLPLTGPVLVSGMVLAELTGVDNVFAPDTGSTAIRDERGHVVAVTRLIRA
jgi:hypothetical protein